MKFSVVIAVIWRDENLEPSLYMLCSWLEPKYGGGIFYFNEMSVVMNRLVLFGILIGFVKSDAAITQSWQFLGLGDKSISAIAIDPKESGVLYVSSGCVGLFKSSNASASWDSLLAGNIKEIVVHLEITGIS